VNAAGLGQGTLPRVDLASSPALRRVDSFLFAAALSCAVTANTAFFEEFTSSRLLIALLFLLVVQVCRLPLLLVTGETVLYLAFLTYLTISLIWTPDTVLGLNTIFPGADFVVLMVMYGSMFRWHDLHSTIVGALAGFWLCALAYAARTGYPLSIPEDFSYNAYAAMYFHGLFLTLLYAWNTGRKFVPLMMSLVLLLHIAATTSIKTSLGILLGIAVIALFYRRDLFKLVGRFGAYIAAGLVGLTYLVLANDFVIDRLKYGYARLEIGLKVLAAREDQQGYQGFDERAMWLKEGLRLWRENPVFGHGVEAFRVPFGITSHSTPVDLLYNSGLIGLGLFYAVFAVFTLRVWRLRGRPGTGLRSILFGCLVLYASVTLSGTVFYLSFIGAFFGIAIALLERQRAAD